MKKSAAMGGIIWCGLAAANLANRVNLSWIELLFLFAPLVIVPLGLELTAQVDAERKPGGFERVARYLQFPAALSVVGSFFFSRTISATAFVLPWLVFCAFLSLAALVRIARGALSRLDRTCTVAAFLYISIGATWLAASRMSLTPIGFQEPIVLLTAVHFHYAGFAAPLLARSTARALAVGKENREVPGIFKLVGAGVLLGPALLAAGFVIGPRLKLVAALVLPVSEIALAISFLAVLRTIPRAGAKLLLSVAAASALFSMALAAVWAVGEFPLQPFVHLDQMAHLHGTANAFGFTLCGLLGWILAGPSPAGHKVIPQ
ncbi:MAG TPA: YndJ family protein [Candidatus Sulfotelmatobacter sp.]|nr:YndJ family protein [Candidatus Sulfotelmatobacter sp.]